MKIEIQEEGKEKQIFFTFKDASVATGIPATTLLHFIKNKKRKNDKFVRRCDRKVFFHSRKKR